MVRDRVSRGLNDIKETISRVRKEKANVYTEKVIGFFFEISSKYSTDDEV